MSTPRRWKTVLAFAAALGFAAVGCMSKQITEKDLIGKYRADLPQGAVEFLELLPEGKCIQEIHFPPTAIYKAYGTWQYFPESKYIHLKGTRFTLTPSQKLNPDVEQIPAGITAALPVSRKLSGSVTIILSEDIDYQKVNRPEPTKAR